MAATDRSRILGIVVVAAIVLASSAAAAMLVFGPLRRDDDDDPMRGLPTYEQRPIMRTKDMREMGDGFFSTSSSCWELNRWMRVTLPPTLRALDELQYHVDRAVLEKNKALLKGLWGRYVDATMKLATEMAAVPTSCPNDATVTVRNGDGTYATITAKEFVATLGVWNSRAHLYRALQERYKQLTANM